MQYGLSDTANDIATNAISGWRYDMVAALFTWADIPPIGSWTGSRSKGRSTKDKIAHSKKGMVQNQSQVSVMCDGRLGEPLVGEMCLAPSSLHISKETIILL